MRNDFLFFIYFLIVSIVSAHPEAREKFTPSGKSYLNQVNQPTKNRSIYKQRIRENNNTFLNISAGKSIGPITRNAAIIFNALLGVMVFAETSLFQNYFFNIAFGLKRGSPIPESAALGFRLFGVTTLLLHGAVYSIKDIIGLSKTLNLYAIAALSRAIVIGAYYFKGVVISSIPVVVSMMVAIVSSYLALE